MKKLSTFNPAELPLLVKDIALNCLPHLHKKTHAPHAVCRSNKVHTQILLTHHQKPEKNISPPFSSRSNFPENLVFLTSVLCAEKKGIVLIGVSSPTTIHTGLTSCSQRVNLFQTENPLMSRLVGCWFTIALPHLPC